MTRNDPHQRAFRAHRIISWAGMEVDEYLQTEWATYAEAADVLQTDRREITNKPWNYRGWRVSWRIEERGEP